MTNNWLSNVPSDWKITKLGSHFKCRNVKVDDTSYPPLSVTKQGILPQMDSVAKTDANDNRKQVLAGDFVINSRSNRKESCGLSELTGSVSLINTVLYQTDADYDKNYVGYLLKNYGFAEEFYRWGHGIVADLWTTRWQEMKNIEIPLPPLKEQKLIFDFLTNRTSKIDQLISNQEKQIEKLKEYRQAIITKAATKGLDPNVPMKNSGVKWIGSIPKFWSVARIKDLVTYNEHQLSEKSNPEQTIEYIDIGSVSLEYGIEQTQSFAFKDAPSRARRITERNDVIISTVRTYLKAIAKIEKDGLIASTGFCVLHPTKVDPNYLSYFCKSAAFCDFITANSYGISYPAIDAEQLVNAYISLPSPNEQKQIVQYIDKKCMLIDKLIDIKDRTRKQLLDFKKSLIYEYVTGKRRVSL